MSNQIFRQKSLDQISSAEELHDYMHVTSPKLWMLLSVIMALVIGFIVYASTVSMENTIQAEARVDADKDQNGREVMDVTIFIPDMYKDVVKIGMDVRLGGETGQIKAIYTSEEDTEAIVDLDDEYVTLPSGGYDATIIIETITPVSFLFN